MRVNSASVGLRERPSRRRPTVRGEPNCGRVSQARGVERDVLQVESEVRRPRCVGCQAAEGIGGENAKLKKLLAETVLDNAILRQILPAVSPCPNRTSASRRNPMISSVDLPFRAMSSSRKWTLEIAGFETLPLVSF